MSDGAGGAGAPAVAEPGPRLRADARRSIETIRDAALDVFRDHGLETPLADVARAAGVSKGTIYHRFGGRQGLIDAVINDLVAERVEGILREVTAIADPGEAFEQYLLRLALLQFDEPAVNDALLRAVPGSARVEEICERSAEAGSRLLLNAQQARAIRDDLTEEDVFLLVWERGIVARACDRQSRASYERRLGFLIDGLRVLPS